MRRLAAAVVVAAALAAGCTASGTGAAPTTTETETITEGGPSPSTPTSTAPPVGPRPVQSGPTTAAVATSCPLLAQQSAADKVGMRLGRITVLTSEGRLVGCRFYAVQGTSFNQSEHLPGPNQPAIEITSSRYASASAAHAAFVAVAQRGKTVQPATITPTISGLFFQTAFYPPDKGLDWACTYSVGSTAVLVKTVVTAPSFNAVQLAKAVAPQFAR